MHECPLILYHLKPKKPYQYILLNRSMFIHKEKYVSILKIMRKWPWLWKKQDVKL
jgi:hypothetical protein